MLGNGLFQPVGLFLGKRETDGFRLHLGRPSETVAGLAGRAAIDRTVTEVADAGEFLLERGIARFQLVEARRRHREDLCPYYLVPSSIDRIHTVHGPSHALFPSTTRPMRPVGHSA